MSVLLTLLLLLSLAALASHVWVILNLREVRNSLERMRKQDAPSVTASPQASSFKLPEPSMPEAEFEAIDYIPRSSERTQAEFVVPDDSKTAELRTKPESRVESSPEIHLPIDEFKLSKLDFESVLKNPAKIGLGSLADKTEVKMDSDGDRIDLVFDGFADFVAVCGEKSGHQGMFVKTPQPRPIGSSFELAVRLRDGFKVLEGRGEVVNVERGGMDVRFLSLDDDSRRLVEKIVSQHVRT